MVEQLKITSSLEAWRNLPSILPDELMPKESVTGIAGELAQFLAKDARVNYDCYQKIAPCLKIQIGTDTPLSSLKFYTVNLFQVLQALDPNSDTGYPQAADLVNLERNDVADLYLKASQALIQHVNRPDFTNTLTERSKFQNYSQTKLAVVLSALTGQAGFTGWQLKYIDQGRGLGYDIKRPASLDEVWGPETPKFIPTQTIDNLTQEWLSYSPPDFQKLTQKLPTLEIQVIGSFLWKQVNLSQDAYQDLLKSNSLIKKIGAGATPQDDLTHEVNNVIYRLQTLDPENKGKYPAAGVVLGLNPQNQLTLLNLMTAELLGLFNNPNLTEKQFKSWGKTVSGRQSFLSAIRHGAQHLGSLSAFLAHQLAMY